MTTPYYGQAEWVAARKLRVTADEINRAALSLWRNPLTNERERRLREKVSPGASPRRRQAIRGHITRALLAELTPHLRAGTVAQ